MLVWGKWLKEVEKYGTTQNKTKEDYVISLKVPEKRRAEKRSHRNGRKRGRHLSNWGKKENQERECDWKKYGMIQNKREGRSLLEVGRKETNEERRRLTWRIWDDSGRVKSTISIVPWSLVCTGESMFRRRSRNDANAETLSGCA